MTLKSRLNDLISARSLTLGDLVSIGHQGVCIVTRLLG